MAKKFLTLIVVPQEHSEVRRLHVPTWTLRVALASLGVVLFLFIVLVVDYVSLKRQAADEGRLRRVARVQKVELQRFAARVSLLEAQLDRLRHLDRKIRLIFNLEAAEEGGQMRGVGSVPPADVERAVRAADPVTREITSVDGNLTRLAHEAARQEQSFFALSEFLDKQRSVLARTPSIRPAAGWITSVFGRRASPFTGDVRMHEGIDISNQVGTPVVAPADGRVTFTGLDGARGKLVSLDHGFSVLTVFGHLERILVTEGQRVQRGQRIATLGNSGVSTGPHLHYEVRVGGVPVNPERYILE